MLTILAAGLLVSVQTPTSRGPDAIRREIEELQARMGKLERELIADEGTTMLALSLSSMKVGQAGSFVSGGSITGPTTTFLRVVRVIDPNTSLAEVLLIGTPARKGVPAQLAPPGPRVILRGMKTADFATGTLLENQLYYRVAGKQDYADATLFVVEPYTAIPAKK